MDIETLSGNPVSILGIAGQNPMDKDCVEIAYRSKINYFFFYNFAYKSFLAGLKSIVAIDNESRNPNQLSQYLDEVRKLLHVDLVDVFFLEYISPKDNNSEVASALEQLYTWKSQGLIRYVGVSTHNRQIAKNLLINNACDILMHRYNMAHRKAETEVFPSAIKAHIPVVAFTATRWSSLLQGHPDWPYSIPTASECYRMALNQEAIHIVLTAPKTQAELLENLNVLQSPDLSAEEIAKWKAYGDLIYGKGQDNFETQCP